MSENYYDILGVDKTATQEDIKKSYKKLVKQHHPDKGGDEEKFKKIASAYDVLSDDAKRRNYDAYGDPRGQAPGGFGGGDPNDILNKFRSAFGSFGGGRGQAIYQGEHLQIQVHLTLEEIQKGADKTLKYKKDHKCSSCKGNGSKDGTHLANCSRCGGAGRIQVDIGHGYSSIQNCDHCGGRGKTPTVLCPDCFGNGLTEKEVTIGVFFPAGVYGGWSSILKGYGHECEMENSIPGNLYVVIEELAHPLFKRSGDNIEYKIKLGFPDLVLGKSVNIPTLEKEITFNIPPHSGADSVFRIKGRGLGSLEFKGVFGDLLVTIDLHVPKNVTEEEKKILQELQKSSNFTL